MVASPPSSSQQSPKASSDKDLKGQYHKYRLRIDHNGSKVSPEFLAQVREVRVEESLYQTSRFTIILDNPYGPGWDNATAGEYTDQFKPGEDWSIYFTGSMAQPAPFQNPYAGRVSIQRLRGASKLLATTDSTLFMRGFIIEHSQE
jgi:hypothetical protein